MSQNTVPSMQAGHALGRFCALRVTSLNLPIPPQPSGCSIWRSVRRTLPRGDPIKDASIASVNVGLWDSDPWPLFALFQGFQHQLYPIQNETEMANEIANVFQEMNVILSHKNVNKLEDCNNR